MTTLVVIEGVVIALLVILVAGLLRSHAEILRRLEALGAGESSSPVVNRSITVTPMQTEPASLAMVAGQTPLGDAASVALTASKGFVLLSFLSSGCKTCQTFWKSFSKGMDLPRADIRPVIMTKGPQDESPAEIRQRAPLDITTIMSTEAWDSFRVPGTPYFQLVDVSTGQVVGEGSAGSWPRLVEMINRAFDDDRVAEIHLGTRDRDEDSSEALRRAGIEPGDPSMFERPS